MIVLVGCKPTNTNTNTNTMTIGVPYAIQKGQTIIREEEPTVVVIETTTDTLVTTATLESGKARIE